MEFCSKERIYNTNTMIEIAKALSKGMVNEEEVLPSLGNNDRSLQEYNIQPEKTDMNTYNSIFE